MSGRSRLDDLRDKLQRSPAAPPTARHLTCALLGETSAEAIGPHRLDELPGYADDEATGLDVALAHPDVKRHLDLCTECAAVYFELVQAALDELAGMSRLPEDEPQPDLSFLGPRMLATIVQQIAEQILAHLAPQRLPDLAAIAGPFFRRAAVLRESAGLANAYRTSGDGRAYDAQLVLSFTYFAVGALRASSPASEPEWESAVAAAARSTAAQMQLPASLAAPLIDAFAAGARDWQPILNATR